MGRVGDNHTHSAAKTRIEQRAAQPLRPHMLGRTTPSSLRARAIRRIRAIAALGLPSTRPTTIPCPTAVRKTHTDSYLTWVLEGR